MLFDVNDIMGGQDAFVKSSNIANGDRILKAP